MGATKLAHLEDALAAIELRVTESELAGSRCRIARTRSPDIEGTGERWVRRLVRPTRAELGVTGSCTVVIAATESGVPRTRDVAVVRGIVIGALIAIGCGGKPEPRRGPELVESPGAGSAAAAEPTVAPGVAGPGGGPASAPAVAALEDAPLAEVVVVARVTQSGPIGDGRCSQRSYEIAVAKVVSGASPGQQLWVHFELCGDARSAGSAGSLAGASLAVGSSYELTLRRGASQSFGDGFMITGVRAP